MSFLKIEDLFFTVAKNLSSARATPATFLLVGFNSFNRGSSSGSSNKNWSTAIDWGWGRSTDLAMPQHQFMPQPPLMPQPQLFTPLPLVVYRPAPVYPQPAPFRARYGFCAIAEVAPVVAVRAEEAQKEKNEKKNSYARQI
jgi:hypothetical protein